MESPSAPGFGAGMPDLDLDPPSISATLSRPLPSPARAARTSARIRVRFSRAMDGTPWEIRLAQFGRPDVSLRSVGLGYCRRRCHRVFHGGATPPPPPFPTPSPP